MKGMWRTSSPPRATAVFLALGVGLLALLPRLVAIGRYITPDELIWVYRSVLFREALLAGRWADTLVAGHPGVVTTWLGALAITLQMWLRPADAAVYTWITHLAALTPDNMAAFRQLATFLSAGRLAVALVNSLGVAAVFLLARRLFGVWIALLAAALLALDPFFAGLSGLLHVDGLMTTLATVALLALAVAVREQRHNYGRPALLFAAVSGAATALAVLTKSPALLLGPLLALFLGAALLSDRSNPLRTQVRRLLLLGVVWTAAFGLVTLIAFPALWASPAGVVATMSSNANRHVEEALRPTFFLGDVAYDHGPLFYPVVLLWRLGPVVFAGLLVLVGLLLRRPRRVVSRSTLLLAAWSVLFIVAITVAAKKFDRYALPVIPALTLLGALAWGRLLAGRARWQRWGLPLLLGVQLLYLLWALPYPLAGYNPLVGGPFTAVRVLPVGWGESISAAGRWLAIQPGTEEATAVSGIAPSLAPFFPGTTLLSETSAPDEADYVIVTANSRQDDPAGVAAATADFQLRHVIHYGGLDQAWIYANPQAQQRTIAVTPLATPISFDNHVRLLATGQEATAEEVAFVARWQLEQPNGRYDVKVTLRDAAGLVWATRETPLLNEVYFYPEHWSAGETPQIAYALDLPPAVPPGTYELELSLIEADTGAQLPVLAADGDFLGVVYDAAAVAVPLAETPPAEASLPLAQRLDAAWLDGALRLLGHGALPSQVATGEPLQLDLAWQAQGALPAGLQLALLLDDRPLATVPLSRFDTGAWRPQEVIAEKTAVTIPPDLPAGEYALRVRPLHADGTPLPGEAATLGQVEVAAVERRLTLPETIELPLNVRFGEGIFLRGADGATAVAQPGTAVPLTLYWQTETQPERLVTAFVHLVDAAGNIVAQADRWPGGLPSVTWAPGQVIVDSYAIEVPPDLAPGDYRWAVGLYTADDGVRLPVMGEDGRRLPDDRLLLPGGVTVTADDE